MTIGSSYTGRPGEGGHDDAGQAPTMHWPDKAEAAIHVAIGKWNLSRVGWRGFEAQPWVVSLKEKYPEVERIARTCSGPQGEHIAASRKLIQHADAEDVAGIKSYFAGKLALEELSCQRNGAGAGLCDKRSAFLRIFDVLHEETAGQ